MTGYAGFAREIEGAPRILGALGAAFNTFNLYPNPQYQAAFQRSVDHLDTGGAVMAFEVRTGELLYDGEEVGISREAVDRFARRLFLHEVEELRIASKPTPVHLIEFFRLLQEDEQAIRDIGGIDSQLLEVGIKSISVKQRGLLDLFDENQEVDPDASRPAADPGGDGGEDQELAKVLSLVPGADEIAEGRVDEVAAEIEVPDFAKSFIREGDPRLIAQRFGEAYQQAAMAVSDDEVAETEDVVRRFVEGFFYLPQVAQVHVVEAFLGHNEESEPHRTFLDQFAGHELAILGPQLSQQAFGLLLAYARLASATLSGRPEELLPLLQSSRDVREAKQAIAERMGSIIEESDSTDAASAFAGIQQELAEPVEEFRLGLKVVRGLYEVEDREHRFPRVIRVWTARISRAIRGGELSDATLLIDGVLHEPPFPPECREDVTEALNNLVTPDMVDTMVAGIAETGLRDAVDLLKAFGPAVVDVLVEHLANEEDPQSRRVLIDLLAAVGRSSPRSLLSHIDDPRWYVLRNLATVLGKTGSPQVLGSLRTMQGHDDHRVRVEAMRALVPLLRSDSVPMLVDALQDSHERVRQSAITLLRSSQVANVDEMLVAALNDDRLGTAEKTKLVQILAQRDNPAAREAVEQLASRRFALSGSLKSLRDAARTALAKKGGAS